MLKPGKYINKRKEVIELINNYDTMAKSIEKQRFYDDLGVCHFWDDELQMLVMDIDPQSDLFLIIF